ncbi:Hypothetical protein I5071_10430 [Sandaracinus amylolyticus]|nr:Hypothetical protein I5071_10430 [Sandaracinus amylolyticus]
MKAVRDDFYSRAIVVYSVLTTTEGAVDANKPRVAEAEWVSAVQLREFMLAVESYFP